MKDLFFLENKKGYTVLENMGFDLLEVFYNQILGEVKKKALQSNISLPQNFKLNEYHLYFTNEIHSVIWPKQSRLFSASFLSSKPVSFWLDQVSSIVQNYKVLDVEKIGYPEVYFRIVRPNFKDDIAGAHTDGAFYSITNAISEETWQKWIKIWSPVLFEPNFNTIGFYPISLINKPHFIPSLESDKSRPVLQDSVLVFGNAEYPAKHQGDVIAFSPHILHAALNESSSLTRVSIEFAIGP